MKKKPVDPIINNNYEQLNKMLLVSNLIATFALSVLAYVLLKSKKTEVIEVPVLSKQVPVQVPVVLQDSTAYDKEILMKGFGFGGPTGQA